jgi:hypothetical protein
MFLAAEGFAFRMLEAPIANWPERAWPFPLKRLPLVEALPACVPLDLP